MTPPLVLVADDDAAVVMTLEVVLEDEGFDVVTASEGTEALRVARERHPDAILLDHMMPGMNGGEVLAALRDDSLTATIPVFVLSGMALGDRQTWPGAHFIGKPFSPEDLVARIRRALVSAS